MTTVPLHFLPIILTSLLGPPDSAAASNYLIDGLARRSVHLPAQERNPLLEEWVGPYGGVPALDVVDVEHFAPALETAMRERLAIVDNIASNPAAPDFNNTILELERSGQAMERVQKIYNIWKANMSTPEFESLDRDMAPKLAAFSEQIMQNEKLFRRVEAIYLSARKLGLNTEQQRLVSLYYTNLIRAGARLNADQRKRYAEINRDLEHLFAKFGDNLRTDEQNDVVVIHNEHDLIGLPLSVRNVYADNGRNRGLTAKWVVTNTRSSVDQFLTLSQARGLREKVWRMFAARGASHNNEVIAEILRLREERAQLLGYLTHAHWRLENSMAKTPENALQLLRAAWKPALAAYQRELDAMQAVARMEGLKTIIAPWDYLYYADKVKKNQHHPDADEVKPYLQLNKLREAMFWIAGEIYNFDFSPATNVPVYHPDVEVWEVRDRVSGNHIGLWYYDPFRREGKRPGARISIYRVQEKMDGAVTTIAANSTNFLKGSAGEPVLLSWEDAMSLFHEFGHALHALASDVTYPSLSGILVPADYVEFPSHLMQHWLATPQILERFALHYKTGEPMPSSRQARIQKASRFNQGIATVEYLLNAWMDMQFHLAPAHEITFGRFESDALASLGVPREIAINFRSSSLAVLFGSDTYSGGYYKTMWLAALIADAFSAFSEAGDAYDEAVAARWREHVFSVGNSVDPAEGYRAFRGRDLRIDALMQKRGIISDSK